MATAFPGRRLRHFQKQGSVKEELKRTGSRVQVELKLVAPQPSKTGHLGSPHWKCRNGRTPFASSNLARSATISGSRRAASPPLVIGARLLVSKEREYAANHHFKGALPSDSRSSALEPLKVFPNLGMGRGGAAMPDSPIRHERRFVAAVRRAAHGAGNPYRLMDGPRLISLTIQVTSS